RAVQLELVAVEVQRGEEERLVEEVGGDRMPLEEGRLGEVGVLLEAGEEEEGVRLERVALLVLVESCQERVLLDDLEEQPRPQPLGEDARQACLAHAYGALDDYQRHTVTEHNAGRLPARPGARVASGTTSARCCA